jgi:hypothetical protein
MGKIDEPKEPYTWIIKDKCIPRVHPLAAREHDRTLMKP